MRRFFIILVIYSIHLSYVFFLHHVSEPTIEYKDNIILRTTLLTSVNNQLRDTFIDD